MRLAGRLRKNVGDLQRHKLSLGSRTLPQLAEANTRIKESYVPQHTTNQWSEGLRDGTAEALRDVPVTPDGRIHMKQIDGGCGWCGSADLLANRYVLPLADSDQSISFLDAEAVVAAGWTID